MYGLIAAQHGRADHTGVVSQLCRNQFAVRLIKALSRRLLAQRGKEALSRAAHAAADGNDLGIAVENGEQRPCAQQQDNDRDKCRDGPSKKLSCIVFLQRLICPAP